MPKICIFGVGIMRGLFFILFFVLCLSSAAQQGLQMDFTEIDSTEMELQRQLEYHQLITGSFNDNLLSSGLELPELNIQEEYRKRYTLNLDFAALPEFKFAGFSTGAFTTPLPFYYNAEVLSQEAYKLSDKFVIGGFSYGANSVFSAPLPNQNKSYFDTYGSTMFMQYKVSKNFKIETRVSVGKHNGPPGF